MYKETCRTAFPSHCLLSDFWYVSQQRVLYQTFLKHEISLLDIKRIIDSYQLNPWWGEEALIS